MNGDFNYLLDDIVHCKEYENPLTSENEEVCGRFDAKQVDGCKRPGRGHPT